MDEANCVTLKINGEKKDFSCQNVPTSVLALVESLGLDPEKVVAELNGTIIKRTSWPEQELSNNDAIELVSFVGGG